MPGRIKFLLNRFAWWLQCKTHVTTATEIMLMEEAKKPRKCINCGEDPDLYVRSKSFTNKKLASKVGKLYPGFDGYYSTLGIDGLPVVVIHKTVTQTELFKR